MDAGRFLPATASVLALTFCAAITAEAATINATYSLTGSGSGDPENPPLIGTATGSVAPLGTVAWMDVGFPNLLTGTVDGMFTMTFGDGSTLFGTFHEALNLSVAPLVPFTQTVTVMGGTRSLVGYHGTLTGNGTLDLSAGTFSVSGPGTLDTTPEPESFVLLGTGLACLLAYKKRARRLQQLTY